MTTSPSDRDHSDVIIVRFRVKTTTSSGAGDAFRDGRITEYWTISKPVDAFRRWATSSR